MRVMVLAGEFEDIGDHLLGVGTRFAEGGLILALLLIVLATIVRRFSLKAGIGALLGMVICLAIYNKREDLSDAFSSELDSAAPGVVRTVEVGPASQGSLTDVDAVVLVQRGETS